MQLSNNYKGISYLTLIWVVHEVVKHHCRQWYYQATFKGSLTEHQRAVHEEIK